MKKLLSFALLIASTSLALGAGSFTGSHSGDGSGLTNIPGTSITGPVVLGNYQNIISGSDLVLTNSSTGNTNAIAHPDGSLVLEGPVTNANDEYVAGTIKGNIVNAAGAFLTGGFQFRTNSLPGTILDGSLAVRSVLYPGTIFTFLTNGNFSVAGMSNSGVYYGNAAGLTNISGTALNPTNVFSPLNSAGGYVILTHQGINTPFPTLELAYAAATTSDTLTCFGGLNLSNSVTMPVGSVLQVNGAYITNWVNITHSGLVIGDNSLIKGPGYWLNATNAVATQSSIGFQQTALGEKAATNFIIDGLTMAGYSDCLLFQGTNSFYGKIVNCDLSAIGFDYVNELGTNILTAAGYSSILFKNDVFRNLTAVAQSSARGANFVGCSNVWENCTFIVDNTVNALAAIASSSFSDVEIFNGGSLLVYGTNHPAAAIINAGGSGSSVWTFNHFSAYQSSWTGANVGCLYGAKNGTTLTLNNCYALNTTNQLNLTATAFAVIQGGNITNVMTTPANASNTVSAQYINATVSLNAQTNTAVTPIVSSATLHTIALNKGWTNDLGARADLVLNVIFTNSTTLFPQLAFTNTTTGKAYTNGYVSTANGTNWAIITYPDISPNDQGTISNYTASGGGGTANIVTANWYLK